MACRAEAVMCPPLLLRSYGATAFSLISLCSISCEGWCGERDSNPHAFERLEVLSLMCLPIPPSPPVFASATSTIHDACERHRRLRYGKRTSCAHGTHAEVQNRQKLALQPRKEANTHRLLPEPQDGESPSNNRVSAHSSRSIPRPTPSFLCIPVTKTDLSFVASHSPTT